MTLHEHLLSKISLDDINQAIKANIADINLLNKNGLSPLHFAIIKKRPEIVDALIANGADLDLKDKKGHTPLHWAVIYKCPRIVAALIAKGANVNLRDRHSFTPLHIADLKFTAILIASGADVNLQDKHGNTRLHVAIRYNQIELAAVLINAGTNLLLRDEYGQNGRTPLEVAIQYRTKIIAKHIKFKMLEINSNVQESQQSDVEIWKHNFATFFAHQQVEDIKNIKYTPAAFLKKI